MIQRHRAKLLLIWNGCCDVVLLIHFKSIRQLFIFQAHIDFSSWWIFDILYSSRTKIILTFKTEGFAVIKDYKFSSIHATFIHINIAERLRWNKSYSYEWLNERIKDVIVFLFFTSVKRGDFKFDFAIPSEKGGTVGRGVLSLDFSA